MINTSSSPSSSDEDLTKYRYRIGSDVRTIHTTAAAAATSARPVRVFFVLVIAVGLQVSSVNGIVGGSSSKEGVGNRRISHRHSSHNAQLQSKCGPYTICELATHFCDTVMNTCVRCNDDCHPGRINGDPLAIEDCRQKCKVYYELEEERDRLNAEERAKEESKTNKQLRSEDEQLQLSIRTIDLLTNESLSMERMKLLMTIETIGVAVMSIMLFVISICLILLLSRRNELHQGVTSVRCYSTLDTSNKTSSG